MRTLLALCAVVALTAHVPASELDEMNARAALALSGVTTETHVEMALSGCGVCRPDTAACWKEAGESGKLLVLYVGGCDGKAKECEASNVIHCRTTHYEYDQCPTVPKLDMERASVPRILIFKRFSATDKRLRLVASLPAKCDAKGIKAECDKCCQCADCHCADDAPKATQSTAPVPTLTLPPLQFQLAPWQGSTCGPNGCGR